MGRDMRSYHPEIRPVVRAAFRGDGVHDDGKAEKGGRDEVAEEKGWGRGKEHVRLFRLGFGFSFSV